MYQLERDITDFSARHLQSSVVLQLLTISKPCLDPVYVTGFQVRYWFAESYSFLNTLQVTQHLYVVWIESKSLEHINKIIQNMRNELTYSFNPQFDFIAQYLLQLQVRSVPHPSLIVVSSFTYVTPPQ